MAYLTSIAVWRIQYYMKNFEIWVKYKSILKISKRREDKLPHLDWNIVYNSFCKLFPIRSGDISAFSPQKYTIDKTDVRFVKLTLM